MFCYSLTLTGIFLVFMVIGIGITNVVARRNLACAAQRQETIAVLTGVVEEYYHGRDVIKAYNHEPTASGRCPSRRGQPGCQPEGRLPHQLRQPPHPYAQPAGPGGDRRDLRLGHAQRHHDRGRGAGLFQYINQTAEPLTEASYMINSLQSAFASAKRTFELLDEEEEIPDPASPAVVENAVGRVAFEHVSFGYEPDRLLMHGISFEAKPGQKIAFVGATGAGKTTITNLINRFYDIDDGTILYDGIDVKKIRKNDLRRSLGIVLQDVNLFTGSVMENIRYGNPAASDEECIAAAKLANADSFIRMLPQGYDTILAGDAPDSARDSVSFSPSPAQPSAIHQ